MSEDDYEEPEGPEPYTCRACGELLDEDGNCPACAELQDEDD